MGATAAVAGAAALWPPSAPRPGAVAADRSTALAPARRRRYEALVAAVAAAEGGRAAPGEVARAGERFAGWYARNPGLRPMADQALDEVKRAGGAHALLTESVADGDTRSDARFGTRGARRQILAAEAVALASPPFAPDRA